jgi:hypothetical protein
MPPLPQPKHSTVAAIYKAFEDANSTRDGRGVSVSKLADDCTRRMFYDFRWVSPNEKPSGRVLRLFETGEIEEQRWIDNLRMIGCEVVSHEPNGKQIMVEACSGHVRGYLDSEILGLPEAPKTVHVGEMKSHNAKSFADLQKKGVRVSKPQHFGQLQTYMYLRGRERGIYLAVCKDNDELYAERVDLDLDYVLRLLGKAQRVIDANEPPSRLSDDPEFFGCKWCSHKPICHGNSFARVNCRTCLYASPEEGGSWSCARFSKPLSFDEQQQACPAHLFLPSLVPGRQTDADQTAETVTYELHDGRQWIDGASQRQEAV